MVSSARASNRKEAGTGRVRNGKGENTGGSKQWGGSERGEGLSNGEGANMGRE